MTGPGTTSRTTGSASDRTNGRHALIGQNSHDLKTQRQRAIRELVATRPIGSQREVVDALSAQGFDVTQATVSRDITELGLVKAPGADGHVYVTPRIGRRVGRRHRDRGLG